MKKLKDIQNLSAAELERIADDASVKVPAELNNRLESLNKRAEDDFEEAGSFLQEKAHRYFWPAAAVIAIAIIGGAFYLTRPKQVQDSFEDPMMAYAEAEKVLAKVSQKMGASLEIAENASPVIEKTDKMLNVFK